MSRKALIIITLFTILLCAQEYNAEYAARKARMAEEMSRETSDAKEAMDLYIEDGYVRGDVDVSGEFEIGGDPNGTGSYSQLTFSWPDAPGTGYVGFKIDDEEFLKSCEISDSFPEADLHYEADDCIEVVWNDILGLKIVERFSTERVVSGGYVCHLVKSEILMINNDLRVHYGGSMIFFDTDLRTDDAAEMETSYGFSGISEIFFAPDIPDFCRAYEGGYPPSPTALISNTVLVGHDAVMPDIFWYGSWGAGAGNSWSDSDWIRDSGSPFGDSAMMVKWHQRPIAPGDTVRYATYYGIQTQIMAGLVVTVIEPDITPGCIDDEITPFALSFIVDNFNPFDIETLELELAFSYDCAYLLSDSLTRTVFDFDSRSSFAEEWRFDYDRECRGSAFAGTLYVRADTIETVVPFSFTIPEASDFEVEAYDEVSVILPGDTAIIHVEVRGGTTEIEYSLEPEEYLVYSAFEIIKAVPEESTIFYIGVSDGMGCSYEFEIPITVASEELAAFAGEDVVLCYDESITLGGSPSAFGGTPPYTYLWTPTDYLDDPTSPNPVASPTESISYTLQIVDASHDATTSEISLIVSPEIIADAGDDIEAELDETVTLGGSPTGSGGYGELSYSWSPGRGLDDRHSPNPTVIVDRDITYTVYITDENLCETTDEISITYIDKVSESIDKPLSPVLAQNSPNPFNPVTRIDYSLPKAANIRLDVFDIMGNRIANLANGHHNTGDHSAIFDATEQPGGVYFYRLYGEEIDEMRKMVFVK